MATPKTRSDSATERAACEKRILMARASPVRSRNQLLLSTTYGLNASASKKLTVGLEIQPNGTFEPVVRLINHSTYGIILDSSSWTILLQNVDKITSYFALDYNILCSTWEEPIVMGEYNLRFTTSHGSKAIIFDPRTDAVNDEGYDSEGFIAKKQKLYTPAIVMQKTTFDGLKNVIVCVDERFRRFYRLASSINQCKKQLVQEICEYLAAEDAKSSSEDFIKKVISVKFEHLKERTRSNLQQGFIEYYFDIVILELTTLFLDDIANEVRCIMIETPQNTA